MRKEQRILTNWSSWLYCNESTERFRTRQLCIKNASAQYWSCNDFDVQRVERPVTTTVKTSTSTINPTTDISTLDPKTTLSPETTQTSTSELTIKSHINSTVPTKEQSTQLKSTRNVGCQVTTPSTTLSTDSNSSTLTTATESAPTNSSKSTTDSVPSAVTTRHGIHTGIILVKQSIFSSFVQIF